MDDENNVQQEETEESTRTYTFGQIVETAVVTVIVCALVVFFWWGMHSTDIIDIPDRQMILDLIDGVATKSQIVTIEKAIVGMNTRTTVGVTFTSYTMEVYEPGYGKNPEHLMATIEFDWSYTKHRYELDDFQWHLGCDCGCEYCTGRTN